MSCNQQSILVCKLYRVIIPFQEIFSVGITTLIDENTLRQLSSDPQIKDLNYFTTADFQGLAGVMDTLLTSACVIPPPTLPPVFGIQQFELLFPLQITKIYSHI